MLPSLVGFRPASPGPPPAPGLLPLGGRPPQAQGSPLLGTLSPLLGSQPPGSGKGTSMPLAPSTRFQGLPLGVPSQPASCAQSCCAWRERGGSEVGASPPAPHQPPLGSHVPPRPLLPLLTHTPVGTFAPPEPTRASWEPGTLSELPGPSRGPWLTARSLQRG
ncbi:unnamed protein product [Gulo gulo]|uniref:Uncharacterized protein n=1 Tax=Gulo gulo TaxID=48420 RepID=A0A9X9LH93_GULGU|nr:unnamed protein product [Gulo gulo]